MRRKTKKKDEGKSVKSRALGKIKIQTEWNLGQLYKSPNDPAIELDMKRVEKAYSDFVRRYRNRNFTRSSTTLKSALVAYEKLLAKVAEPKPFVYLYLLQALDSGNSIVQAKINLYSSRLTKSANELLFFELAIGRIPASMQKKFLKDKTLAHFHFLLSCIFEDAKHDLTEKEERILSLKSQTSSEMWESGVERALGKKMVQFRRKQIPISEAASRIPSLTNRKERAVLHSAVIEKLKELEDFAESEINALYTNKKINDELREFKNPYDAPFLGWKNSEKEVITLIQTVQKNFSVSKRFFRLKARLLGAKKLKAYDHRAVLGHIRKKFSFKDSVQLLVGILESVHPRYSDIFVHLVQSGCIDVLPKRGKRGGAFQAAFRDLSSYVFLNHVNDFNSFSTLSHEIGHALHSSRSRVQSPFYFHYTTSAAEIASTFFEGLAFEKVLNKLEGKDRVYALHDKILDSIKNGLMTTADFLLENELHKRVRANGFISASEIAYLYNEYMSKYEGNVVERELDDGYTFIRIPHMRLFYYSYPYAYGILIAKAFLRRYREDPSYIEKIDQFLSAGGSDTPSNILRKIGIDTYSSKLWQDGIDEIKRDIRTLEKCAKEEGML
jgi:oligoendopeptidase F